MEQIDFRDNDFALPLGFFHKPFAFVQRILFHAEGREWR